MQRKNILTVCLAIVKLLEKEKGLSVNGICYSVRSPRNTVMKCLEFLKELNLVEEKKENLARIFYLKPMGKKK